MKTCCDCKQELPISSFTRSRSNKDGRSYACRECCKVYKKQYYEKNKAAELARSTKWARANRERVRRRQHEWYVANREKVLAAQKVYYEENREKVLAQSKAWAQANRDKMCMYSKACDARRRAQIRKTAVEAFTYEDVLDRDGLVCHICGGDVEPDDVHFDHVRPLSRGGTHTFDNVKVAHSKCNMQKGAFWDGGSQARRRKGDRAAERVLRR